MRIRKFSPENIIPVALIVVFGALSLQSPIWTVVSFLMLVASLHVIYKRIRKKCSSFYFSFTLTSLIGAHLVYEINNEVMRISYLEYIVNIFLFTSTLYMMYRTKVAIVHDNTEFTRSDLHRDINAISVERRKLAMVQEQIPSYNYCRRCNAIIPGRDHHCVWLNVCIGKANRNWFLGCLTIAACWIGLIANIFLNSICYPVSFFSTGILGGGGNSEGPITWMHHYGLLPVTCPEAYVKTSVTICFVTSVYGLFVLLFIIAVLVHQLRLLYKGCSYLELKYAGEHQRCIPIQPNNIPYNSDSSLKN